MADISDILQTSCQVKLLDLGVVRVTGNYVEKFLQGQLTCDVREINENQHRLGAHCDVKGRVHVTFYLFLHQEAYYFLLPQSMIPHLLLCLTKYAVFSKACVVDVSQDWQVTGLIGPEISDILAQNHLLPHPNTTVASFKTIISLAVTGTTPRFILLAPNEQSISFLNNKTLQEGVMSNWHLLDIIAGIPTIYPKTIGQFTPHQLNYPAINGVSFNKGCYIGQEIIARTHYLGVSKSRLYNLAFQANTNFPAGTPIQTSDGSTQGTLIMAANEKNDSFQALACLQMQAVSHTIWLESPQGPPIWLL